MMPSSNIVLLGEKCVMKKWSPTHRQRQPVEMPCCQRSDNLPVRLDVATKKKPTDLAF
jgi:hypothetical protein